MMVGKDKVLLFSYLMVLKVMSGIGTFAEIRIGAEEAALSMWLVEFRSQMTNALVLSHTCLWEQRKKKKTSSVEREKAEAECVRE